MLIGVLAESSARMNEDWLSEDAWRAGVSNTGVPTRLNGLEKLNEGRGSPDASELIDGDRGKCAGENRPLPTERFRSG